MRGELLGTSADLHERRYHGLHARVPMKSLSAGMADDQKVVSPHAESGLLLESVQYNNKSGAPLGSLIVTT